jgi:hypothetical protein
MSVKRARVNTSFPGVDSNDLPFVKGDVVILMGNGESTNRVTGDDVELASTGSRTGFFKGRLTTAERVGEFPVSRCVAVWECAVAHLNRVCL